MKLRNNVDLTRLLNFGFSKLYRYKGSIHSGLIGYLAGYDYVFYDEVENTNNSLIYIDKKTRVIQVFNDYDYSKTELEMREKIISELVKNNLVEQ